ncbi:MAG TPA: M20/M25/M40 family metallo-hydrolase [Chloroflexota bacterium]|nr:M20/M25/M40 family metallo-hydrolase [Chloroflexota bacterium]
MDEAERFAVIFGAKGDYYADVWVDGPAYDLHSSLAAIVQNPAWRLTWALATLKAPDDTITIDGFMDCVRPPTEAEQAMLEKLPLEEEKMREEFGIAGFISSPDSALARAAADAARQLYGEPILYPNFAGSGPMDSIGEDLGLPIAAAGGTSYYGTRAHAPDEHIRVQDFLTGIKYIGHLIDRFGTL